MDDDADEFIDIYSYQVREAWEVFQTNGVLFGDAEEAIPSQEGFRIYTVGYDWMERAMGRSLDAHSGNAPVWGWVVDTPYPQSEDSVLLHARIPKSRILLSWFPPWDTHVLFQAPLPEAYPLHGGQLLPPDAPLDPDMASVLCQDAYMAWEEDPHAVEQTWERILTPHLPPTVEERRLIQACVDGVFLHQVHAVYNLTIDPVDTSRFPIDLPLLRAAHQEKMDTSARLAAQTEIRLGNALCVHPAVLEGVKAIRTACHAYMVAIANGDQDLYHTLLLQSATPLDLPYAGRLGDDIATLSAFWEGDTSLVPDADSVRSIMTHFHCFITRVLGPRLPSSTLPSPQDGSVRDLAVELGWDTQLLEALLDVCHPDPEDVDLARLSFHPLTHAQNSMREATGVSERDALSSMSVASFVSPDTQGQLSEFEHSLVSSDHDEPCVPWLDASQLYNVREDTFVARAARDTGVPLLTGFSGCTLRYMIFGSLIAPHIPPSTLRAASLAFLLPTRAHSFFEVIVAAQAAAPDDLFIPNSYHDLFPTSTSTAELAVSFPLDYGSSFPIASLATICSPPALSHPTVLI